MSCPSCGEALPAGQGRCACGATVAPPAEGALAPDLSTRSGKVEPLRELAGMRRRERTWKDEVRERVRERRKQRGTQAKLPLFGDEPAPGMAVESPVQPGRLEELPLRPPAPALEVSRSRPVEDEVEDAGDGWPLEMRDAPPLRAVERPVERPAYALERVQAAAVDLALLAGLWSIVLYFASRAARTSLPGLWPSWPWLLAYMAFLGLAYATYFTGTTGQTVGKRLTGLRVVETSGRPPGYLTSFLRAAAGAIGVSAAGLGLLPILLDPARRAAHDRLVRTRVVKR